MAKKRNIAAPDQPGLFDLFDAPVTPRADTLPPHPSIEEFIVKVRQRQQEQSVDSRQSGELDEPVRLTPGPKAALMFKSFGSGSSGNCAFVGNRTGGILIDAGVDVRSVTAGLASMDLSLDNIHGICITHDHSDHVSCVYSLVRRHSHIRVFCTPRALSGILRRHSISRRLKDYHTPIYKEFPFKIGPLEITAFEVSHDGSDNSGFHITAGDAALTIATDLGCITDRVDHYMRRSNFIVIETNYDAGMLRNGRYPAHLKARIAAPSGHLDNREAAAFLAGIATPQLKNIFLCHLSADNNTPAIALTAVADALGVTPGATPAPGVPRIEVLPRFDASPLYILRK